MNYFLSVGLGLINVHLNTFQGYIGTIPDCNRWYNNQLIVLSHWNITPPAQSYGIPPGHVILATGQPVFAFNYPLYVERLTKELQLPIL